ncbi:lipoyl synthase [candidate division bacterium WOR-3 4484_18]|uniref:Lipoyl synthase n=1 Tax=candidate division WOR-3 bacterium 4484_18 TaxID=2020626 RepID=A0A257LT67_UNCW3|nr:MAG: lipoyl synthase [candidate division bacterium WOR-3 4484_18]
MHLPSWIKERHFVSPNYDPLYRSLHDAQLHTICEEARCPNIVECYRNKTATFLILGDICTRGCRFCAVKTGIPKPIDPMEPERIACLVEEMCLDYVVITSVTRDDLQDGGAHHFVDVVHRLRQRLPHIKLELLIPDFKFNTSALEQIIALNVEVLNHNIETVERLTPIVRPQASYRRSLDVLRYIKRIKPNQVTKSGMMVGLGETDAEVYSAMEDLRDVGVDIITIGQYLRPTRWHLPVARYVHPDTFRKYKEWGKQLGFKATVAGTFVRSSYKAKESYQKCLTEGS